MCTVTAREEQWYDLGCSRSISSSDCPWNAGDHWHCLDAVVLQTWAPPLHGKPQCAASPTATHIQADADGPERPRLEPVRAYAVTPCGKECVRLKGREAQHTHVVVRHMGHQQLSLQCAAGSMCYEACSHSVVTGEQGVCMQGLRLAKRLQHGTVMAATRQTGLKQRVQGVVSVSHSH